MSAPVLVRHDAQGTAAEAVLDVRESKSRICAIHGAVADFVRKGLPSLGRSFAQMGRSTVSGAAFAVTHSPVHSYQALVTWVKADPMRAFGYAGLASDVALMAAGGISSDPMVALSGLSGMALETLLSVYGERMAPVANAMMVVQGVSMALAGAGATSPQMRSVGEIVDGLAIAGGAVLLGKDDWKRLYFKRPKSGGGSEKSTKVSPIIDVASSTSHAVAVNADMGDLGRKLQAFSKKFSGGILTSKNLTAALFTAGDIGLAKAALWERNPLLMAAAAFSILSTLCMRVDKTETHVQSARPSGDLLSGEDGEDGPVPGAGRR
ncbi:hypothetical protein [Telmatospirillum siberiense]|uniref:Uncharacterized protein n=1 Tax=Telmatospirillum siberiense TaxID=382514 RepID=A0A2N3PNN0_9PROT|nr:hypothetical protein [Telmatospirillum siberiense]PKU21995.1 hypothetical protein CWS72_24125 [Telmatospirillum siberiense]